MIQNFKDDGTEDIFNGLSTRKALKIPKEIWPVVRRKLDMLNTAHELIDLRVPPGNKLEKLGGRLTGFHSIRVNDQYRIIFKWLGHDAEDVLVTDYH